MADWKIEGLKSATETAKQILTLSTAVITITVTLFDKLVPVPAGSAVRHVPGQLTTAWVLLGLSILAALLTLMAITGTLVEIDDFTNGNTTVPPSGRLAYRFNVRLPALAMTFTFLVGMVFLIVTAFFL